MVLAVVDVIKMDRIALFRIIFRPVPWIRFTYQKSVQPVKLFQDHSRKENYTVDRMASEIKFRK
jgi:hypothetical protein